VSVSPSSRTRATATHLVRDAIAGIRAAGAKISMVGDTVVIRATPEQKQRIEPYADILRKGKRDEVESCLAEADQPADPIGRGDAVLDLATYELDAPQENWAFSDPGEA
jgi:hypothetical protein